MVDSKENYKFDLRVKRLRQHEESNHTREPTQDEIARIRKRKRGGNMQLHVSVMFT